MHFRMFSKITKKLPITITNNAWTKIKDITNKSNGNYFIFSAIGRGCGGFNYNLELLNKTDLPKKLDTFTYVNNGHYKVYIDPLSELYLLGTCVNYLNQDYSKGIYESKFVFLQDKMDVIACGCGLFLCLKIYNYLIMKCKSNLECI